MNDNQIEELKAKSQAGDAQASLDLGLAYFNGDGVAKSLKQATKLITDAAVKGNPEAEYRYAIMIFKGLHGKKPDTTRAVSWLLKAVNKGHTEACREYGLCFINGVLPTDYKMAYINLSKAVLNGSIQAMVDLASLYINGSIIDDSNGVKDTLELLEKAVEAKNFNAANLLGVLYSDGQFIGTRDLDKSYEYFKQAYDLGLKYALYNCAQTRKEQYEIRTDKEDNSLFEDYINILEKVGKDGFSPAYADLAQIYLDGVVVEQNYKKAKRYIDDCFKVLMSSSEKQDNSKPSLDHMIDSLGVMQSNTDEKAIMNYAKTLLKKINSKLLDKI